MKIFIELIPVELYPNTLLYRLRQCTYFTTKHSLLNLGEISQQVIEAI